MSDLRKTLRERFEGNLTTLGVTCERVEKFIEKAALEASGKGFGGIDMNLDECIIKATNGLSIVDGTWEDIRNRTASWYADQGLPITYEDRPSHKINYPINHTECHLLMDWTKEGEVNHGQRMEC